jgi:hypothetical protein
MRLAVVVLAVAVVIVAKGWYFYVVGDRSIYGDGCRDI